MTYLLLFFTFLRMNSSYSRTLVKSGLLTALFLGLCLTFNRQLSAAELALDSPFFIVLFFLLFTLGHPSVVARWQPRLTSSGQRALLFPSLLIGILYSYLIVHGHSPFQSSAGLFIFFLVFPTLGFIALQRVDAPVAWSDVIFLLLIVIPATSISFGVGTSLPFKGSGFSNAMRLVIMISAVYGFSYIRRLPNVGFYLTFRWNYLFIALGAWLSFLLLVAVLGYFGKFLNLTGHDILSSTFMYEYLKDFVRILCGTALFEELFLRGILQNLITCKVTESPRWNAYLKWGFIFFFVLSFVTGYLVEPKLTWFPMLTTALLFGAAYLIERQKFEKLGTYTALAITSVFFGLVHFHAGSMLFVGLASVAGWAYGYTYLKTQNVFYAALVHTLVNSSEFLFHI